jgi:myo-inositol 2-dehydrogenase/D-chiro-inositol 1-dehydrogenase
MNDDRTTTRRVFVKRSATMLAGVALGGRLDVARVAHAAGAERLQVALIGCGGRGCGATMDCLMADPAVRVVALADAFEERAKKAAELLKRREEASALQFD